MRKGPQNGFTLIELLVACTVLAFLVLVLFSLVDGATKLWRNSETRVDAYREARAALHVISRDLNTMFSSTNLEYFSLSPAGNAPADAKTNGIFFLTRQARDSQEEGNKSDLCAVGYYLRWTKQNDGLSHAGASDPTKRGFHLYRALYGSDVVFDKISDGENPLSDIAEPTISDTPSPEMLARNVCDFEILCYVTNAAPPFSVWTKSVAHPIPQMVEIRLTAISDDVARKIGDGDWSTNNPLVSRDMRTFVARIPIKAPASK